MSLIRFESDSLRGPSAALFQGLVDWVRGSLSAEVGTSDYDDYKPYNSSVIDTVGGSSGAAFAIKADVHGAVHLSATAGSNANVEITRKSYFNPTSSKCVGVEASILSNAAANSPQTFVGLTDVAAGSIFSAGAIASGGTQNTIGVLFNADKTVDIVSVVAGTLAVLVDNVGVSGVWSAAQKLGVRIEQGSPSTFRVTAVIGGVRGKGATVASTKIPNANLKPCVAHTVSATTAPNVDVDWNCTIDR